MALSTAIQNKIIVVEAEISDLQNKVAALQSQLSMLQNILASLQTNTSLDSDLGNFAQIP